MTCTEFQEELPYIIDSGGNFEHQTHLQSCAACGELVADLNFIADQAKLLVPSEDPPPQVWEGIQRNLERAGVQIRPAGKGRLLGFR